MSDAAEFTHRNINGGMYRVLGTAQHPDTGKQVILYVDAWGCLWWRTRLQFDRSFTPLTGNATRALESRRIGDA